MKCPYCENGKTNVVDTRESSNRIRRRRECQECERRFTTYETVEKLDVTVVKGDGTEEEFDEAKIREGIEKAAEKTGMTSEEIDNVVEEVKNEAGRRKEVESSFIGKHVMEKLKEKDEVAYIRFASVYQSFEDAESFQEEVESLQKVRS